MNMNGKSEVTNAEVNDCAKNAAANCPVEAISVE